MTYSIVARDQRTGELGVAVQSHYFSVGSVVSWAEAGVGAVATQSFAQPSYGPLGLDLMRAGVAAGPALGALVHADSERERRQVGMVDAQGGVGAHTGTRCIEAAGHATADGVSIQANMMRSAAVWPAMLDAYRSADGDLADRMLAALDAGEEAGGDLRGRQSAAILVVAGTGSGRPWQDRLIDLRVEDSAEPLAELRRLLTMRRGYRRVDAAEERDVAGDLEGALAAYAEAEAMLGDNIEATFWLAVMLARNGRADDARRLLVRVTAKDPCWADLLRRLPAAGMFEPGAAAAERLLAGLPEAAG